METPEHQPESIGFIERAAALLRQRESQREQAEQEEQPSGGRREEVVESIPPYSTRIGEDTELIEAFAERIKNTVRFSAPSVGYSLATALRDATYRRLRSRDTASAHVVSLALAVSIELILAFFIVVNVSHGIQTLRVAENLIIGVVYAEPILATPTALPQSNVVGLVWLAALVLAIVILRLLWSGYLAKSKNEKAQTILQHLVNTVLSIATGALVSKGLPY